MRRLGHWNPGLRTGERGGQRHWSEVQVLLVRGVSWGFLGSDLRVNINELGEGDPRPCWFSAEDVLRVEKECLLDSSYNPSSV